MVEKRKTDDGASVRHTARERDVFNAGRDDATWMVVDQHKTACGGSKSNTKGIGGTYAQSMQTAFGHAPNAPEVSPTVKREKP